MRSSRAFRFQPDKLNRGLACCQVPTLVIGHHVAPAHRRGAAEAHAETIPGATLRTVPSKDADPARFVAHIQTALHDFLRQV